MIRDCLLNISVQIVLANERHVTSAHIIPYIFVMIDFCVLFYEWQILQFIFCMLMHVKWQIFQYILYLYFFYYRFLLSFYRNVTNISMHILLANERQMGNISVHIILIFVFIIDFCFLFNVKWQIFQYTIFPIA